MAILLFQKLHWNVKETLTENKEIQDELNMLLDNM